MSKGRNSYVATYVVPLCSTASAAKIISQFNNQPMPIFAERTVPVAKRGDTDVEVGVEFGPVNRSGDTRWIYLAGVWLHSLGSRASVSKECPGIFLA